MSSVPIFFYDTEFLERPGSIDLISIGIVGADGREYYAVNSEMDQEAIKDHHWLKNNVWPHLPLRGFSPRFEKDGPKPSPDESYAHNVSQESQGILNTKDIRVKPLWVIANEVRDFLTLQPGPDGTLKHIHELYGEGTNVILWADHGAYDHVVLMWLWGVMMHKPDGLPMYTRDLQQRIDEIDVDAFNDILSRVDQSEPAMYAEMMAKIDGDFQGNRHNALDDARHNLAVARVLGIVP